MTTPTDVLDFWFATSATTVTELGQKMRRWYAGGPAVDREIQSRFLDVTEVAVDGGLEDWVSQPKGWLALIILIDQFARSVFRGAPRAFAGDARAVGLALDALEAHQERALSHEERQFVIMPLVHSESLAHQTRALAEMERHVGQCPPELLPVFGMGLEQSRKYLAIVERFGRFPHRNAVLGRTSTPKEVEFLKDWESKMRPNGMQAPAT